MLGHIFFWLVRFKTDCVKTSASNRSRQKVPEPLTKKVARKCREITNNLHQFVVDMRVSKSAK